MIRIGRATHHSNETRGFHAPGTTGPFGAAIACGHLFGFDAEHMTNALGIAGSLSSGLVAFARSGDGAMVKRLHFGRASEGGLLAASLAADGFTGPSTVLEGDCGFLKAFCDEWDDTELTAGLRDTWLTSRISMKRYACHTACHTPVQAIVDMKANRQIDSRDIQSIEIKVGPKELRRHNIRRPSDVMIGQYSVPFSVALAIVTDARDPRTFRDADVNNPELLSLMERIRLVPWDRQPSSPIASATTVTRRDGTTVTSEVADFRGTPDNPLNAGELRDKALLLTRDHDAAAMTVLFDRLLNLEAEPTVEWIRVVAVTAKLVRYHVFFARGIRYSFNAVAPSMAGEASQQNARPPHDDSHLRCHRLRHPPGRPRHGGAVALSGRLLAGTSAFPRHRQAQP